MPRNVAKEARFYRALGRRIRASRKEQLLTCALVASESGMNLNTLSRAERGIRPLSAVHLFRIAQALAMSVDDLMPANAEVDEPGPAYGLPSRRDV